MAKHRKWLNQLSKDVRVHVYAQWHPEYRDMILPCCMIMRGTCHIQTWARCQRQRSLMDCPPYSSGRYFHELPSTQATLQWYVEQGPSEAVKLTIDTGVQLSRAGLE